MTTPELLRWARAWEVHKIEDAPVALQDEVAAAVLALARNGDALAEALADVRTTCRVVMQGRSVIASVSLSGAIDVIDDALRAWSAARGGGTT